MNGSYQFEALEDRQREAACLAERATMRLEGFIALVRRHGFDGRGRVLDVGCGQGVRSRMMAEHFPQASVVGVDRSNELLAIADTKLANLKFVEADLYALPFEDHSFDLVYARLVFMHLNDPQRALQSLRRVLKPGGRILIEDADRDCMFFEPAPPSFADFWRRVQDGQRRLGGDPNVGRKLAPLLQTTGFTDVRIENQPLTGGGADIDFLARTLMPSLNLYLTPDERPKGEAAIADLNDLAKRDDARLYHFWFTVSAANGEAEHTRIAPARASDIAVLHEMMVELAEAQKARQYMKTTHDDLTRALEAGKIETFIAWEGTTPVGYALIFHSFSSWVGKPSLYLEDLYVAPQHRGKGHGRALLQFLAKLAVDRNCGRFEWAVLNWNEPAIGFYKSLGAEPVDSSTIFRMSGEALQRLAGTAPT